MRTTKSSPLYDESARKRPANLSVNTDLLEKARRLGINLSKALEKALESRLAEERRERWLEENGGAIDVYNRRIEAEGAFGDGIRRF